MIYLSLMQYSKVYLEAWGYVLPEKILTSSEIEKRLDPIIKKLSLPSGFFEIFTGIRERRVWDKPILISDQSAQASQNALREANLKPENIEALLHVSVSRECLEPATACIVHHKLGLPPGAMNFDISNACLGFLNGFFILANMIELGQIKRGLVVGCETSYPMIEASISEILKLESPTLEEVSRYLPSLTLGSGAAAFILTHESVAKGGHKLLGVVSRAASEHNGLCRAIPDTGLLHMGQLSMKTEAQKLMEEGLRLSSDTWPIFKKELGWETKDIDHFFAHQVGRMPREEAIKRLGVPSDKDYSTFPFLGNMGSVALPITFQMGLSKRNVKPKDKIALMGYGSGINCLFCGLQW